MTHGDELEKPRSPGEAFEQIFRAVATLERSLQTVAKNQDSFKTELKTVAPRIDGIGVRIDVLAAEIAQLADRVHRTNNIVQVLIDEGAVLHQAQQTLGRALDIVEHQFKSRAFELERTQGTAAKMLETLEERVRGLRSALADATADTSSGRRSSIPPVDRKTEDEERTRR
jgi:chromosome segregation ATPase